MIVLGIQEAHDAGAALMIGGRIIAAAQEERFTGLKGDYGFPRHSIDACLKIAGIDAKQIDTVALATHNWNPVLTRIKRNANFSVADWVKEQHDYWKPTLLEGRRVSYYELFRDRADFIYDTSYPMDSLLGGYMNAEDMQVMRDIRLQTAHRELGIPLNRIRTITHEDCHTFYSYFGSAIREPALALTCEGFGDHSNGSVSLFTREGRKELSRTTENHLGHIYQYITLLLGMKPVQHEYKVMGLAPYANERHVMAAFKVFERIQKISGLDIVYDQKPRDLYFHFRDALEGHRFDAIAGAVQKFVEKILCEWVSKCVQHTGVRNLVFSGGVAQNIKACKRIAELAEVESMYVCPAAGDTSLPIGACYVAAWEGMQSAAAIHHAIEPMRTAYLGPAFSAREIQASIEKSGVASRHRFILGATADSVAARIAEGQIIGRCAGRMEFGLRALGNRSILADPRRHETVRKINAAIKYRDFWMPFTPTILAECQGEYLLNPKALRSPFMTMAFDSTARARRELTAAMHPADFTIRPQILEREHNPEYYDLISAFHKLTGVGAMLNTSFNLHGEPIVLGPDQAIRTFEHSELDGLLLGDTLIVRAA